MKAEINHEGSKYSIDFSRPLDISIPLRGDAQNVNAWYLGHPRIEPHEEADFVGKVSLGSSVNFNDIWFNPHAHGTHTECVGHITSEKRYVEDCLPSSGYLTAVLVSVEPIPADQTEESYNLPFGADDQVITAQQLQSALAFFPNLKLQRSG